MVLHPKLKRFNSGSLRWRFPFALFCDQLNDLSLLSSLSTTFWRHKLVLRAIVSWKAFREPLQAQKTLADQDHFGLPQGRTLMWRRSQKDPNQTFESNMNFLPFTIVTPGRNLCSFGDTLGRIEQIRHCLARSDDISIFVHHPH